MALVELNIPPGIVTERSAYDASPAWIDSDKVRFRAGRPESWNGWRPATSSTLTGTARAVQGWRALDNRDYYAFGTHQKLEVLAGGSIYDITPARATGTLGTDPFSTTDGSPLVTVNQASHNVLKGDFVSFSGATAVNGITVSGEYEVTSVTDNSNYVLTASTNATGTGSGGGSAVAYTYNIHSGPEFAFPGLGWGASTWGASTWGTPRTDSEIVINLQTWSLDNWGEDLIANPRGDYIYLWDRSAGTTTKAAKISNSPLCNFAMVSPTDRSLIAFGGDSGTGTIDPMLVQWSDQEDYTTWTAAPDNSAGDFRLVEGTKIVGAVRTRNIILIFTDRAVYGMQFTGAPFTFSFFLIATGVGLMGPHAMVEIAGTVYWMDRFSKNFYLYNGAVQTIPCTLLNHVQNNIDGFQHDQVYAYLDPANHEVTWLWPSTTSSTTSIDRYTSFNYMDGVWYHGSMDRSTWLPAGIASLTNAMATDFSGNIFSHDLGNDANQANLSCFVRSAAMEITPGDHLLFMRRLIPDYETLTGSLDIDVFTYRYPNDTPIQKGDFTQTSADEKLMMRARGRQFEIKFSSDRMDTFWRLGKFRVDIQPDGMR